VAPSDALNWCARAARGPELEDQAADGLPGVIADDLPGERYGANFLQSQRLAGGAVAALSAPEPTLLSRVDARRNGGFDASADQSAAGRFVR
jgi:hypothetical protein